MNNDKKIKSLVNKLKDMKSCVAQMQREISETEKEIDLLKKTNHSEQLKVSDHAIVRYLERKLNYDIASIRNEIISNHKDMVSGYEGNCDFTDENGINFVFKNYTLVTII